MANRTIYNVIEGIQKS